MKNAQKNIVTPIETLTRNLQNPKDFIKDLADKAAKKAEKDKKKKKK